MIKLSETATRGVLCKKVSLETLQNLQENTCTRAHFLIKLQVSGLVQVFSCKFCEISKNTFFTEQASKPFKLVSLSSDMALANLKETFLL